MPVPLKLIELIRTIRHGSCESIAALRTWGASYVERRHWWGSLATRIRDEVVEEAVGDLETKLAECPRIENLELAKGFIRALERERKRETRRRSRFRIVSLDAYLEFSRQIADPKASSPEAGLVSKDLLEKACLLIFELLEPVFNKLRSREHDLLAIEYRLEDHFALKKVILPKTPGSYRKALWRARGRLADLLEKALREESDIADSEPEVYEIARQILEGERYAEAIELLVELSA